MGIIIEFHLAAGKRLGALLVCRWLDPGMGCLEKLWSLHPCMYSKPNWMESWGTCSTWLCLEQGDGIGDFHPHLLCGCASSALEGWGLGAGRQLTLHFYLPHMDEAELGYTKIPSILC